jgi:type II secretory pathway component PulM
MEESRKMNAEIDVILILQSILATLLMIGVLAILCWVIHNPALEDEEMREVLERSRSMREEVVQRSHRIARQESEQLYH